MRKGGTDLKVLKRAALLLAFQAVLFVPTSASAGLPIRGGEHVGHADHISQIPMTTHEQTQTGRQKEAHKCQHKTEKCIHLQSYISLIDEKCKMKCSLSKTCKIKKTDPAVTHTMLLKTQLPFIISEGVHIAFETEVRYISESFLKPVSLLNAPPVPPPLSIKALS